MLIVLDRDGVINQESSHYIRDPDEWCPLPGSVQAIVACCQAGFKVVVATNQSGIGRGYFSLADMQAIHTKMENMIRQAGGELSGIYYCPHLPSDNCCCRKPKPGLLLTIAKDFRQELAELVFIGDSLRDIQAAEVAGVQPVWVLTGNGEAAYAAASGYQHYPVYADLATWANSFLSSQ